MGRRVEEVEERMFCCSADIAQTGIFFFCSVIRHSNVPLIVTQPTTVSLIAHSEKRHHEEYLNRGEKERGSRKTGTNVRLFLIGNGSFFFPSQVTFLHEANEAVFPHCSIREEQGNRELSPLLHLSSSSSSSPVRKREEKVNILAHPHPLFSRNRCELGPRVFWREEGVYFLSRSQMGVKHDLGSTEREREKGREGIYLFRTRAREETEQ